MYLSTERVVLLDEAAHVAQMIIDSEAMVAYRQAYEQLVNDREALTLIRQFNQLKERYEEVQRFGKYHPDFRVVSLETRQMKRDLDLHPMILAYKQAEDRVQKLLDEISVLLGQAVSEQIKVPTGNPYFDMMGSSCSGGCGSGGSCGCSA